MITSLRGGQAMTWLTESPIVAGFAVDLNGLTDDDTEAAQWILRVLMSLLYWPVDSPSTERQVIDRFVLPAFAERRTVTANTTPRRPANGKQVRADRTRAMVIDETVRCVIEEGFAAASAKHITERAGVTWE